MVTCDYLKTFDPVRCHEANFKVSSRYLNVSFDEVFYFFMRYATILMAICLFFSGFRIGNPFQQYEPYYLYSLERVMV